MRSMLSPHPGRNAFTRFYPAPTCAACYLRIPEETRLCVSLWDY